jgi:geranylgeranyl diphosphate synthase type II
MAAEGTTVDLPHLELIHVRKPGALIRAAVRSGALLGNARADQLRRLTAYADRFGLAFQIADDILDAEAPTDVTGKTAGRDRERRKAAYPALLGLAASKDRARDLVAAAVRELQPFGPRAEPLRALARFVVSRCGDT